MRMKRPYDHTNPESIEEYGKLLVGKTLRQTVPENDLKEYYDRNPSRHKGGFGEMVEKLYFGISPGNSEGPDFLEAGVELKTNPLIINTQSSRIGIYSAKERLSLNLIKLNQQYAVNLKDETKFYCKNGLIILIEFMEGDIKINPIDYYYTNPIARASKIMSECRQISKNFLFTGIEKAS